MGENFLTVLDRWVMIHSQNTQQGALRIAIRLPNIGSIVRQAKIRFCDVMLLGRTKGAS
jgi:hypothetical protein